MPVAFFAPLFMELKMLNSFVWVQYTEFHPDHVINVDIVDNDVQP
jgi:hypothetical protein